MLKVKKQDRQFSVIQAIVKGAFMVLGIYLERGRTIEYVDAGQNKASEMLPGLEPIK
jgi:hypothetical protein